MMNKKILVPSILVILITIGFNLWMGALYQQRNMQSFLAAGIDKETLLADTPAPRIILVGGSNVAFGFNSARIQQVTGLRTINMGLQGSLGIRFQLNSLKPYLAAGDIVVLSPEYNNFSYGFIGGDVLGQYLVVNPGDVRYLSSLDEIYGLAKNLLNMHTGAVNSMLNDLLQKGCYLCKSTESVYYRQAFNAYGDITTNSGEPDSQPKPLQLQLENASKNSFKTIQVLNDFSEYAADKGIQVYLVYPASSVITDQPMLDFVHELEDRLHNELELPVLGSVDESQYPAEYMFNTYYHLNTAGALVHTDQFLGWLCAADTALNCQP